MGGTLEWFYKEQMKESIMPDNNISKAAVQLRGLSKYFGNVTAVAKMDLDIAEGSLTTILGPSGCGKTTILRIIAGLETPTEGDIYIMGKKVNDTPIHKRNIGMIFQNYALFPHKTIFDNVAFGLKYRNIPKGEIREKVKRALDIVRLPGIEDRMPSQISGGQQQRIALARAIVIEPDLLLMDEPLSALDEHLREEMRRELGKLQKMLGVTTVFVTHDQREALSMYDKIVIMKDGQKQQDGPPEEIFNYPANHFVANFLGHSNFFDGVITSTDEGYVKVRVEGGPEYKIALGGSWAIGEKVEIIVRAQQFGLREKGQIPPDEKLNIFNGKIRDRSYMGGEVRYFIELESGSLIHVITDIKSNLFKVSDEVSVYVAAKDCRILRKN